jgi:hypothetical protein
MVDWTQCDFVKKDIIVPEALKRLVGHLPEHLMLTYQRVCIAILKFTAMFQSC